MDDWTAPPGWNVITLKKTKRCHRCSRRLDVDTENLIQSMHGRYRFRCVDADDCQQVRNWGSHPIYRKRLMQLAATLDQARA